MSQVVSNVVPFPIRHVESIDDDEIDLLSAVDLAIRDLREIYQTSSSESAQLRARECLTMLEGAYAVATRG